jgi:hypothetical protein
VVTVRDLALILSGIGIMLPMLLAEYAAVRVYYGFPPPRMFLPNSGWPSLVGMGLVFLAGGTGFALCFRAVARLLAGFGVNIPLPQLPFAVLWALGATTLLCGFLPMQLLVRRQYMRSSEDGFLKCLKCGYSLRGAAAIHKTIRCPECGQSESVGALKKRAAFEYRFAKKVRSGDDLRAN